MQNFAAINERKSTASKREDKSDVNPAPAPSRRTLPPGTLYTAQGPPLPREVLMGYLADIYSKLMSPEVQTYFVLYHLHYYIYEDSFTVSVDNLWIAH